MDSESLRYRCEQDICDSSFQYCEESDKRCSTCTPEQCEREEAERIFNQCKFKCKEWLSTTTIATGTPIPQETACNSGLQLYQMDIVTIILLSIVTCLVIAVILLIRQQRKSKNHSESTSSLHSQAKPLLYYQSQTDPQKSQVFWYESPETDEIKHPIPVNTESPRAENMVRDMDILNDATIGGSGPNSMDSSETA